ncbi:MAG: hypothetical protein CSB44_03630 [Gammaproteobacteria bacterium]|nr:MAG: hypothetical protein CSB44_03630 [Gammaproteobacteria bacterium]
MPLEKETVREIQVPIEDGTAVLSGVYSCPAERCGNDTTFLFIHGSGMLDRDSNHRKLKTDVFRQLSAFLLQQGFSTLRYDKRGCGESGGDFRTAGHHDLARDALAVLKQHRRTDPDGNVILLGHSEGSLIAASLSKSHPELIDGLVFLAPPCDTFEQTLIRQLTQIQKELKGMQGLKGLMLRALPSKHMLRNQSRFLEKVKASRSDTIRHKLRRINVKWIREMLEIDPEEHYAGLKHPFLTIGGEKDLQCRAERASLIAELNPGIGTTRIIDNMTHMLRTVEGTPGLLSIRSEIQSPMDPEIGNCIADWATITLDGHDGRSASAWLVVPVSCRSAVNHRRYSSENIGGTK